MKSEEKSIQAISAQAHSESADNRLLRKKLQARDKRVVELEAMVSNLNKLLCEKVDQLNDMMQKLVASMTGNGEVNLSDSLREAVVAGVRAEFEAREQKLKEIYASELEKLTSDFNARLAAKQNEINQLKGINDGDNPTTTMPSNSNIMDNLEDRNGVALMCDGYSGYDWLKKVNGRILCRCVVHARRPMERALKENLNLAKIGILFYQNINLIEEMIKEKKLEGEKKAQFWKDYAEPLWEDFKLWATSAILDVPKDSNIYIRH